LTPLAVNEVIRETLKFLSPQFQRAGIDVRLDLAEHLPPILGDRTRLSQVFLNLAVNSIQAMEQTGRRRLTMRSRVSTDDGRCLVVDVEDTGKGFSGEQAEKLFDPFYSTKEPGQGTGLGLPISQRIIREHGGELTAEGQPGRGARFTIRLPQARDEDSQEAADRDI
jgi:signal transduction histidine kinase